MKTLKIGIVEDELIIANNLIRTLSDIGYHTTEAAVSYSEAIVMLQEDKPDLVLLDINLSGRKDGIDVAAYINEKGKIPFIFLTANSDIPTLERAKRVAPDAYLIKPFTKEELFVSIEVAVSNYNNAPPPASSIAANANVVRDFIFLRNKQSFTKVLFSDVLFIESQGNYVTLYLASGDQLLHRSTLAEIEEILPAGGFYRTHRSFIVRTGAVRKIEDNTLLIGSRQVPVSKDRISSLLNILGIHE